MLIDDVTASAAMDDALARLRRPYGRGAARVYRARRPRFAAVAALLLAAAVAGLVLGAMLAFAYAAARWGVR